MFDNSIPFGLHSDGTPMVQPPTEASPEMPRNAIQHPQYRGSFEGDGRAMALFVTG